MQPAIDRIRSFNRTVTLRVGALDHSFLGRGFPLGHARLLFELAAGPRQVRQLRETLGLDSGYVSRMLRSLEKRGLVSTQPDEADRRVRVATLTAAGQAELDELGRLADASARALLGHLAPAEQERLVAAMATVEALLLASEVVIAPADPESEPARQCLEAFFAELDLRFESGFAPDRSLPAEPELLRPPAGWLLLATAPRGPVGCGAIKLRADGVGEIKRMWVDPTLRGCGLGRRLLEALEQRARDAGAALLRLETNASLTEAQGLYDHSGFRRVEAFNDEPYAHHWFEKSLG